MINGKEKRRKWAEERADRPSFYRITDALGSKMTKMTAIGKKQEMQYEMYKLSWSAWYLRSHGPCGSLLVGYFFKTSKAATPDTSFSFQVRSYAVMLIFQLLIHFISYSIDITRCLLKIKR